AGVREITLDRVEDDGADHMADVARLVDGRTADIHADLAGCDRFEFFLLTRKGVVDAQGHGILVYSLSISTTAWQAIASARPMLPTPSPVLALMFTVGGARPSKPARWSRMRALCGPSFGSCAKIVISVLTTRQPAWFRRARVSRRKNAESRSL